MTAKDNTASRGHLTDEELFGLALPPAGEPEALPPHLLQCLRCGRALQEWKATVRDLAEEDAGPVVRRSAEEWRAVEDRTIAALRRGKRAPRRRALAWSAAAAAALLLAILVVPSRRSERVTAPESAASELSPQDAADDALLRDVARLSRGEDGADWNLLAPDPRTLVEEEDAS